MADVVQFECPFCAAVAEIEAALAGQEANCPACGCRLVVPEPIEPDAAREALTRKTSPAEGTSKKENDPAARGRPAKQKLWQAGPAAKSSDGAAADLDLPPAIAPAPRVESPLTRPAPQEDVIAPPGVAMIDVEPLGVGGQRGRRAAEMAREERERVRFWANAVMLVGSVLILCSALAGLMYVSSR